MIEAREFIATGPALADVRLANEQAGLFVSGLTARGYGAVIFARDLKPGEFAVYSMEGGHGWRVEFRRAIGEPVPVASVPEDSAL